MSRLQEYEAYLERVRATGSRVITVTMPCCSKQLDVHVPNGKAHEWTSLMECPHCGTFWMSRKKHSVVGLGRPSPEVEGAVERHVLVSEKKVTA